MSTASWIAERAREVAAEKRADPLDVVDLHIADAFELFADKIDAESRRIDVERGMLP